jgi:predicted small lipoprotein YifL
MIRTVQIVATAVIVMVTLSATGCGQKGALYLRDSPPPGIKPPKAKPYEPVPYPPDAQREREHDEDR